MLVTAEKTNLMFSVSENNLMKIFFKSNLSPCILLSHIFYQCTLSVMVKINCKPIKFLIKKKNLHYTFTFIFDCLKSESTW